MFATPFSAFESAAGRCSRHRTQSDFSAFAPRAAHWHLGAETPHPVARAAARYRRNVGRVGVLYSLGTFHGDLRLCVMLDETMAPKVSDRRGHRAGDGASAAGPPHTPVLGHYCAPARAERATNVLDVCDNWEVHGLVRHRCGGSHAGARGADSAGDAAVAA